MSDNNTTASKPTTNTTIDDYGASKHIESLNQTLEGFRTKVKQAKVNDHLQGDLNVKDAELKGLQEQLKEQAKSRDEEIGRLQQSKADEVERLQEQLKEQAKRRDEEIGRLQQNKADEVERHQKALEDLRADKNATIVNLQEQFRESQQQVRAEQTKVEDLIIENTRLECEKRMAEDMDSFKRDILDKLSETHSDLRKTVREGNEHLGNKMKIGSQTNQTAFRDFAAADGPQADMAKGLDQVLGKRSRDDESDSASRRPAP